MIDENRLDVHRIVPLQSEHPMKLMMSITLAICALTGLSTSSMAKGKTGAYLQISLKVNEAARPKAAGAYATYKAAFLTKIAGATSKTLLVRTDDVQVMHGFESAAQATAYLKSTLFTQDVVGALGPLLSAPPEVRIYAAAAPADAHATTVGAFLQISLKVDAKNRSKAGAVYAQYRQPFLTQIKGALTKELIMRDEDVQVLHGFETAAQAQAYLATQLFTKDVVGALGPLLAAKPEVRIYTVAR